MGNGTTEKTGPGTGARRDAAMHPLDAWLRRELQAMYAGQAGEPLPPGIADLAARLEEAMGQPGGCAGDPGEPARSRSSGAQR